MKTKFKIVYFITSHSKSVRTHGQECPYGEYIYAKFIFYKSWYVHGKLLTHIKCSFCAYATYIDETAGLLLSGPKSSFQIKVNLAFSLEIKVPESGGRVERHRIHVAWSPVWSFHSQWWFGLPCPLLGCSTVFSEVHSQRSHLLGHFRALHASFCWQALWRCWFHFPAGLGTCPHCQRYQKLVQWPWCYCSWLASKLAWPEPHRESMGYCQEEDERHQTQQCRWPEGRYQSNLGFITPEQCHGLIASMPRRIDAVIHTKGGSTSIECREINIFSEAWHFCLKCTFFNLM